MVSAHHSPQRPESGWLDPAETRHLVSVIVPTYNRRAVILDTLESVRSQCYRPIELIVVDDGSTDDTASLVRPWLESQDSNDFRATFIALSHQGVSAARNAGLVRSKGQFIQFLDSDDVMHPRALTECVAQFHSDDIDTVVFRHRIFRSIDDIRHELATVPSPNPFSRDPERRPFFTRMGWDLWMALYRRSLVVKAGPFQADILKGETYRSTVRLKLCSTGRHYVPLTLMYYRRGTTNALTSVGPVLGLPQAAKVVQAVHDSLSEFHVDDPLEWRALARRALIAYVRCVQYGVTTGRHDSLRIARRAAARWSPLAGVPLSLPEWVLSSIFRFLTAVRNAARRRQAWVVTRVSSRSCS